MVWKFANVNDLFVSHHSGIIDLCLLCSANQLIGSSSEKLGHVSEKVAYLLFSSQGPVCVFLQPSADLLTVKGRTHVFGTVPNLF